MLLLAAEDQADKDVAAALHLNAQTAYQLRKRSASGGLEAALYDKPRLGSKPRLDGNREARLVALAGSQPDERESPTRQRLADKLAALEVVDETGDETVRRTLERMTSVRSWPYCGCTLPETTTPLPTQ